MKSFISKHSLYLAFAVALASMLGSLYFSEVLHYPPCAFCWYQRIVMYPLVAILWVGIVRKDRGVSAYVLPLSIIGIGLAVYQNLLQWQIIPEQLSPCSFGISCATRTVIALNFLTIPLLSLVGFVVITVLMVVHRKSKHV